MSRILVLRRISSVFLPQKLRFLEFGACCNTYVSSSCSKPTLTMFTKDQCSLCDDAKVTLGQYKHRFSFEEVYITSKGNEDWYMKYKYDIPVFHLNGTFLMKHRVDEALLEKKLVEHEKA